MCNTPWKHHDQKRGPLNCVPFLLITLANITPFLIHSRKIHVLLLPSAVISMSSNLLFRFFYWNSLIQKDVWIMKNSEWELYVAAKLFTNFKHLKGVITFLLILDKKQLTCKISKERKMAIFSVAGSDNLSSNLWIITLRSIT